MANPEFRKTILIGLGGAGQQIVLRTKRFFLDTYGVLPPSIKLFCLDTDNEALSLRSEVHDKSYSIEPQEFLHLQVVNPAQFVESSRVVGEWFVKPVPVGAINNGAGAVRENGRLAFFYHIKEIIKRLDFMWGALESQTLATEMVTAKERLGASTDFDLSDKSTEIFVCGSIAGGTGSGTFIDMGILLRHLEQKSLIHGFFLMPWPYRNMAFARRVRPNSYAALTELDNLQSIMYGKDDFVPYQIRYGDEPVTVKQAPYDLFHLIDGRNEHGENIDDVGALCETIANAIFLSMGSMSYRVGSVVDNLRTFINVTEPREWRGRYARYSSLGVSSIYYPAIELHRLLSASNALQLCHEAIKEVETGKAATGSTATDNPEITKEVEEFLTQLNLYRSNVQAQIGGHQAKISVELESYEIADSEFPSLLKARFEGEQKKLQKNLDAIYAGATQVFQEGLQQAFDRQLKQLMEDPKRDSRVRRDWASHLADHLTRLRDNTAQEVVETTERVGNLQKGSEALLETAVDYRYIPVFGGHRKGAAMDWAEQVSDLLNKIRELENLRQEQRLYEDLLARLETLISTRVPQSSEIIEALLKTGSKLHTLNAREEKNLEILRGKSNHVLLGYGNTVVIRKEEGSTGTFSKEIVVSFDEFKNKQNINSNEFYLDCYREDPEDLYRLFYDHCYEELKSKILDMTVDEALETLGEESGHVKKYTQQQFEHLFRLSSALWSFDRGRVSEQQSLLMDKIINIGYHDKQAGDEKYKDVVGDAKTRFHITTNVASSSTGDPYRIWMLNFAAAIPAYFFNGLREAREIYQEEITPTYHIDKDLEMNVPDLFPVDAIENRALRILAMAIVPGIDVIHDEKLTKGHLFSCDHQEVRNISYQEPRVWRLFRDMYRDVKDHNPDKQDNLLDVITGLLKKKVESMEHAELRRCIEKYVEKVQEKLDRRGFSRLISARLTYQEIQLLKRFLNTRRPYGFAMDIDRYINGK